MNKRSLIIPMAGKGTRFLEAGYSSYKPFLRINNKKIIDGVLEPFESLDEIFIITTKKIVEKNANNFKSLPSKVKILYIDEHKLGPAYSIYLAIDQLPSDREYFIAYCDVWWSPILNINISSDIEAAIYVHRGFHPHLVDDNFSAFCKEEKKNNTLLEIKEKESFTNQWMDEPVSVGIFFVKQSKNLFNSIKAIVQNEIKAANEFYPSLIFNIFVESGITVNLIDVATYAHIGVPSQMQDLEYWSKINEKKIHNKKSEKLQWINCMLMGGDGTRMKEISNLPKYMLPVENYPMFAEVAEKFNCKYTLLVTKPDFIHPNLKIRYDFIKLKKNTDSHYETFTKALEYLPDDTNILFTSCDCYGSINREEIEKIIAIKNVNCIVFAFKASLLQSKAKNSHTSINIDEGFLIDVDIKSKDKDYSNKLAGFFWFRNKKIIYEIIKRQDLRNIRDEILVDHLIKELIKNNKPAVYQLNDYIHLGTANEYLEYKYWMERGTKILVNKSKI